MYGSLMLLAPNSEVGRSVRGRVDALGREDEVDYLVWRHVVVRLAAAGQVQRVVRHRGRGCQSAPARVDVGGPERSVRRRAVRGLRGQPRVRVHRYLVGVQGHRLRTAGLTQYVAGTLVYRQP